MECLLPFSSPYTSLPSSKLPSDIQTMLRLELHSARAEHIFHAPTETSDTGATAPTGVRGESRRRGKQTFFSQVTLGQTENQAAIYSHLEGCSSGILSTAQAAGTQCKLATSAHSQAEAPTHS